MYFAITPRLHNHHGAGSAQGARSVTPPWPLGPPWEPPEPFFRGPMEIKGDSQHSSLPPPIPLLTTTKGIQPAHRHSLLHTLGADTPPPSLRARPPPRPEFASPPGLYGKVSNYQGGKGSLPPPMTRRGRKGGPRPSPHPFPYKPAPHPIRGPWKVSYHPPRRIHPISFYLLPFKSPSFELIYILNIFYVDLGMDFRSGMDPKMALILYCLDVYKFLKINYFQNSEY